MSAGAWRRLALALAIIAAALLLYWDPRSSVAPRSLTFPAAEPDAALPEPSLTPVRPREPASPTPAAPATCRARADVTCEHGDVYWIDSCGKTGELAEGCAGRGCNDGRCRDPKATADDCGKVTAYGECAGSLAQVCFHHKLLTYDCGSKQRCVMTSEGAVCMPRDDKLACEASARPRCNGSQLRLCVDGRWRSLDCALRRATCSEDGGGARCVASELPALPPLPALAPELCNGRDDDDDGKIDEGDACAPVPLVAFIPDGARLVELEARMADELNILNRVYAPQTFRWAQTLSVPGNLRVFDPNALEAVAEQLAQRRSRYYLASHPSPPSAASEVEPGGYDFYVAVLYTERLRIDPPKTGLSTLPNARCGSVRLSDAPSPVSGLIVLSEARQPETLAHEMGHYLGLCHTHEQLAEFVAASADVPECQRSGDSICDTPDDPGPPSCFQEQPCELTCEPRPAHPDPFNIMSYYIGCRRVLTQEQLAVAATNLGLRRGWFRCQDPRDCPCDPHRKQACPRDMSCEPIGADHNWLCQLDGAAAPGASCRGAADCSLRAFCLGPANDRAAARCIRPCDDEPGCTCRDVGLDVRICAEDLD